MKHMIDKKREEKRNTITTHKGKKREQDIHSFRSTKNAIQWRLNCRRASKWKGEENCPSNKTLVFTKPDITKATLSSMKRLKKWAIVVKGFYLCTNQMTYNHQISILDESAVTQKSTTTTQCVESLLNNLQMPVV